MIRFEDSSIVISFLPGDDIEFAVQKAIEIAKIQSCRVYFSFNGVPIKVGSRSEVEGVIRYYNEALPLTKHLGD